jgi:TM2 domain-containing membrane protein YozV
MTDKPTPPPAPADIDQPSPITAAILAWLIPGAGPFYIGYNGKALLFFVSILGLMLFGSALGDWKIVVPPETDRTAPTVLGVSLSADLLWYVIHLGAGLVTLFFTGMNKGLEAATGTTSLVEIGHLYTRVAGMLNILLVLDAYARASTPASAVAPVVVDSAAESAAPDKAAAAVLPQGPAGS